MRILILHDKPDDFKLWLNQVTAGHQLFWAREPSEVQPALEQAQPEVVLSIKHSDFPGESHRRALLWPTVKWFHVGGSGTDHLGAWDPSRVRVSNSVGCLAPFHAERAMAALLCLSTGMRTLNQQQSERTWSPTRFETLQGKTMVIVGLGRTGTELAQRAKAFGMTVWAVRKSWSQVQPSGRAWDAGYPVSALADIWPEADVLSLNVPLTPETHHLLGPSEIASLPAHCLLLNGSRGAVIDNQALLESLHRDHLGGVWLDVTEREPLPTDSPLWSHPKVLLTPHCADQVHDFPLRFAKLFHHNLVRYENGEELVNVVTPAGS